MTTSLAGWLATRSAGQLVAALAARPDLALPPPRNLSALASRALSPASVQRALEGLDAFTLQVLRALALEPDPVRPAELQALLPGDDLGAPLARLETLLLAGQEADGWRVPRPVRSQLDPVAGLGRPVAELLDDATGWAAEDELRDRISGLSPGARKLLTELAAGVPRGRAPGAHDPRQLAAGSPLREVVEQRLVLPIGVDTVELPREVGVLLHDSPLGPSRSQPPAVAGTPIGAAEADAAGAHEAAETVRLAAEVVQRFGASPPAVLRSGGLGVRELKALARALDQPEPIAALLVEVLFAAGLLDQDYTSGAWAPTPDADRWSGQEVAKRWAALATGWLDLERLPHRTGERDDRNKPLAALSPELTMRGASDSRRLVLRALASLPAGQAVTATDLGPRIAWFAPLRGTNVARLGGPLLAEAARLGVTGRGALTTFGRALLAGEDSAGSLAPLLPPPVTTVLLQADLTAIAPGPLRPDLADRLAVLAGVESAGAGTVYRFTEAGVRRALDSGQSAEDVLAFLESVSSTPVPQPLSYLVGDVARRHGLLRAGSAMSYLRSDDTGLIAEVLASRATAALKFRRIAPTALVCAAPVPRVLEVLRAAGYAPVGENAGGGAVLSRQTAHRVPRRERWSGPGGRPYTQDQLAELATRLLAEPSPEPGAGDLEQILATIEEARRTRSRVRVEWLGPDGQTRTAVGQPLAVHSGQLTTVDAATGRARTMALSRVCSAVVLR